MFKIKFYYAIFRIKIKTTGITLCWIPYHFTILKHRDISIFLLKVLLFQFYICKSKKIQYLENETDCSQWE